MGRKKILAICLTVIITVCICTTASAGFFPDTGSDNASDSSASNSSLSAVKTGSEMLYTPPEFKDAVFRAELAYSNGTSWIDTSSVSDGYVAAAAVCPDRLKFQIKFGDMTYNFDLPSDGTPVIFPLVFGNGDYTFRIMRNIVDKKYAEEYSVVQNVALADPFGPYLRPNVYVPYTSGSNCINKAREVTASAHNQVEVVEAVYYFIISNVTYDYELAATVQSGYVPNPDVTLATGKGICFDYSALAAAMLRSLGIPTKEVHGYVSPNGLFHAWNMFYTPETGWVTVHFTAGPDGWLRMDTTFGAAGQTDSFIGDGTNYTDAYYY